MLHGICNILVSGIIQRVNSSYREKGDGLNKNQRGVDQCYHGIGWLKLLARLSAGFLYGERSSNDRNCALNTLYGKCATYWTTY